jgi:hypothetical protein
VIRDRFEYSGEFSACKVSVQNYLNSLDEFYQCKGSELQDIFAKLTDGTVRTYNCYVDYFDSRESGDPTGMCPPVQVPRYVEVTEATGLEVFLGVPACVRSADGQSFAPTRKFQLGACKKDVDVFLGKSLMPRFSRSAKNQYDNYMQSLRSVLDRKSNEAVRKFNCMAQGQRFCV